MAVSNHILVKLIILLVLFLILIFYYASLETNYYGLRKTFTTFYLNVSTSQILNLFIPILTAAISNRTTIDNGTTNITNTTVDIATKQPIITTTTGPRTTLDAAEMLVERPPPASRLYNKDSKSTIVAFLFQTRHHVLADLQLYLIRKFAMNLVAIELFTDGPASADMSNVANRHNAILNSFPSEKHQRNAGPSDRNTDVVNWAISTRAKQYLGNGSAVLLLDGDVFPLSPFDSGTLLDGRDVVCRKHPALFARFCWIGFICISPYLYNTIGDFNVSQSMRAGKAYDSGGKTVEYFLKYENSSFSWMKETILLKTDKDLFWGAVDGDIQWIAQNFARCDKCGPEIFFSPFNGSDAVFYHMISGTSEWRFGHQGPRRQALHDSIMKSPYGPNQEYSTSDLTRSVKKVQKMELIPFHGTLTCAKVCQG
jgi:hypothetical protein